jgi:hypothetical protein
MALTNNTKFRRVDLVINKKVNGSLQTTGGWPKQHAITQAFATYPAITQTVLATMTESEYGFRLNAFYSHLESIYPFFDRSAVQNSPSGTDAVLCPLDNSPAPAQQVIIPPTLEFLISPMGGYQLVWQVSLALPAVTDTSFYFNAHILDKSGNLVRIETLYGIIRQGTTTHNSFVNDGVFILIPEGFDPMYAPLSVEYVPSSMQTAV